MRWTILCIAACWLLGAEPAPAVPHGGNAGPAQGAAGRALPSDLACLNCHPGQGDVLAGPMATRRAEREFACRAFGREGEAFFSAACAGCHVSQCRDCHEGEPHVRAGRLVPPATVAPAGTASPVRIADETCLRCHQGYFTGWEYHGRAPREDHERYRRGPVADGAQYLKMLPDVHQQRGLGCVDCHRVHAANGAGFVRTCRECHAEPSRDVPEHAITAHLEKMECWACHSAWAAQEYGTFLVRPLTAEQEEAFAALPEQGGWRRSAALRRQDPPPLGLNARGLVSPIRPQFVLLASDPARGWENRLLTAEWKAFFPHTVRRGTVTCGGCHDNPRRFVLEPAADRIYELERDGLPLRSWWDQAGQRVVNGAFFTRERYDLMNRRTPEYVREHLRQWQNLLQPDASSSRP
ncbi:MAG: cytochrome C [bacterium]|nr:cytochrome C [bacterium]